MKLRRPRIQLILVLVSALTLSACLRFVPSRDDSGDKDNDVAGAEAFYAYEKKLDDQLERLVAFRLQLVSQSPQISSYKVGPGDLLEIKVFGLTDMDATERVTPNGEISLPLVGTLNAQGRTIEELRAEIAQAMETYVRNPQISVFIREYEAHKVSVVGKVASPGVYPLMRSDYTLLEVLSKAGGRTADAAASIILIPAPGTSGRLPAAAPAISPDARAMQNTLDTDIMGAAADSSKPENAPVSIAAAAPASMAAAAQAAIDETGQLGVEIEIDKLTGGLNRPPLSIPLFSGDTIIVPESGAFEIDGEVKRPGSYPLSSQTSTLGAVAAAGGLTYSADVESVEVIRDIGEGRQAVITLDLEKVALKEGKDIQLRSGDLVRVPSASGRFASRQVVEVINSVFSGVGGRVN